MTEKEREQNKARQEKQSTFESRVAREARAVLLATERKAKKRYAGGVNLDDLRDAPAEPGEARGEKGTKLKNKEKK